MSSAISILLPFYNARSTLPACIRSIQAQTLENWELVAVDDHSSDDSGEWLRRLGRRDARIRLISNPGKGLVSALNHGLQHCSSELVARMDADDIMHPRRLEMQLAHLQASPALVLSATRARLFPDKLIQAGYREYMRWQNLCCSGADIAKQIYIESPFAHPTVCYRKTAIENIGGYRDGMFPEDYDLWLRLFHSGHAMEKIDEVLLHWRESPGRLSRTDPRCSRESFDRLKAEYLAKDPRFLKHRDNFVIWGAGRKTRRRCRHLLDQGFQPRAWIDIDPAKIGNQLQGAPVVDMQWLRQNPASFVLIYVANHGAREEIAAALTAAGYSWGKGFLPMT
ncbi:glycosyltransferase family 2 protein [Thiolapillus sp.]